MFKDNGQWKEFGIGRDPDYFTWMPFWLFTILWSVISYIIIMLIEDSSSVQNHTVVYQDPPPVNSRMRSNIKRNTARASDELTPGYYMLNEGKTGRNGIPRYVYLGPEAPETPMPEE